jgi:hypothetical protein
MKKLYLLLLILASASIDSAEAQWIKEFNFRNTSGYCTDGANATYALCINGAVTGDAYPVTRNSVTFGFDPSVFTDCRTDQEVANCDKLAGRHFRNNNGTQTTFRVDLPNAGTYRIRLALGDNWYSRSNLTVQVYDNATLKRTVSCASTTPGQFCDATGTVRANAATWISANAAVEDTFATTTFFLKIGTASASSDETAIAHLSIEEVTSSTPTFAVFQAIGAL